MKTKLFLAALLAHFLISGCGPSEQEVRAKIAREQFVADSINQARAMQQAIQDSLTAVLIQLKGRLEVAETQLQDSKQFQFLRTGDEKQQQIQTAKEQVEILKIQIQQTESQITH